MPRYTATLAFFLAKNRIFSVYKPEFYLVVNGQKLILKGCSLENWQIYLQTLSNCPFELKNCLVVFN